jgi:beta-1,4-mannosyltransferase
MPGWLGIALGTVGFMLFLFILVLLPDDAYGEEDARVFSNTAIRPRTRVQVVVVGDIGRSPRMQYHALSLSKRAIHVDLIGYTGQDGPLTFSRWS